MRSKPRIACVILAVAMFGTVSTSGAQEATILDVSLGYAYDEDFQASDGGWDTTEVPPPPDAERPDPVNPSWEHGEVPGAPERPAPTNPQWEWGVPTSGPGQAHTGTNVWGTNLAGNYATPTCAAIMSPAIDLTDASAASVSFQHWVHMDASATTAWHMGLVFVTTDGGNTLTRIVPDGGYPSPNGSTTARNCLDAQPSPTTGFSGGPSADWTQVDLTLDAYTGEEVQIVLGMGTDSAGNNAFQGWYMDAFAVTVDGATEVEDFETDGGGFTLTSTQQPAGVVPPGAHSGSNVWATFLGGALSVIECSGLMSPPIDLSGANSASVAFHHWYQMRELASSAPHAGLVFATTDGGKTLHKIDPDGGYFSRPITLSTALNCLDGQSSGTQGVGGGPPAGWEQLNFGLDAFLGEESVQIVLGFRKDAVGTFSGWYMDSFATTVDGVTEVEDFEDGDGGFQVVSVEVPDFPPFPKGWEWGSPTTGPDTEGRNVWATQLHEDHGHLECSWIESPPFQVGPIPNAVNEIVDATLSWNHWFRSNSIYGSGVVQVGLNGEYHILEPEGGYPATIGSTTALNQEVTQWQTDCFGMEWEPGDPLLRGYSGLHDAVGGPMNNHRADLTDYAGEQITLRFVFATGWRDVNPVTHPGWYINDVDVEVRVHVTGPSPEGIIEDTLAGQDAPGWSSDGPDNEWAWGLVGSGPSGELAYGTNLNGPYGIPHCGYIESPPVSGSAIAADPTLSFDHWYGLSQSGTFAWYAGLVLVSADDGPWQLVEPGGQLYSASTPSRTCVNTLTGTQPPTSTPAFGGWQLEWQTTSADLSEFADADEVKVRFVMGGTSTTEIGCSDETPCEGWFIRNVVLGGQDVGPGTPGSLLSSLPL